MTYSTTTNHAAAIAGALKKLVIVKEQFRGSWILQGLIFVHDVNSVKHIFGKRWRLSALYQLELAQEKKCKIYIDETLAVIMQWKEKPG